MPILDYSVHRLLKFLAVSLKKTRLSKTLLTAFGKCYGHFNKFLACYKLEDSFSCSPSHKTKKKKRTGEMYKSVVF